MHHNALTATLIDDYYPELISLRKIQHYFSCKGYQKHSGL